MLQAGEKYPASPLDLCSMQTVSRMLASDVQISRPDTTRILRMVRHADAQGRQAPRGATSGTLILAVGEKEDYVSRAMRHISPYLQETHAAA